VDCFLQELNEACALDPSGKFIQRSGSAEEIALNPAASSWESQDTPVDGIPIQERGDIIDSALADTGSLPVTQEYNPTNLSEPATRPISHSALTVPLGKTTASQPIRFGVSQQLGGRFVTFTDLSRSQMDFVINNQGRIRAGFIPDIDGGFCLHIKGINCFLRLNLGSPSSAIQAKGPSKLMLITPQQRLIAEGIIHFSEIEEGRFIFSIGNQRVTLDKTEALWLVALDFGASEAFRFLFTTSEALKPGILKEV
jgi:hypothetical protein